MEGDFGDGAGAGDQAVHRVAVHLHSEHRNGLVDERIFGGFLEHMGRAVYEGAFDPGHPSSTPEGFRSDVLEALRPLRVPVVRYPGGNFVSGHDWRDAIGPVDQRPRRPDFAWRSIETHQFGTDEFMAWCATLGTAPMMAVNLGTGTPAEAAALVEYCNLPPGTSLADLRGAHGHPDPYGVKLWCLGNEMDGPWQAGHVPATTYAERASVAAQLMKGLDPSIETVVCGSSSRNMPTYLEWDRTVLEHCWDQVDYISAHRYSRNDHRDTPAFLAEGVVLDELLDHYRGVLAYVGGVRRSAHRVHLSFDEWNVWYREMGQDGGWQEAPHLLEEIYELQDALVCAQYINAFVRHADLVKVACIAQLVNVIAPILTSPDGVLVQSIYWPLFLLRSFAGGASLSAALRAPEMATRRGDVPVVDVAAVLDEASGVVRVSLVNRDPAVPAEVVLDLADRRCTVDAVQVLDGDPTAANTWASPDVVVPHAGNAQLDDTGAVVVRLPAPSLTVLHLATHPR
jgi:alpha-L-arabinofuranosidase